MLRMDINQLFPQFFHGSKRYRGVVDKGPALSRAVDFPSHDTVCCIIIDVILFEKVEKIVFADIKMSFNQAFILSRSDEFCVGSIAFQEANGPKYDAFACSRLACNDRKSGVKVDVEFINQRKVLNM